MKNRPAIPIEIARKILIESGHKCAVCGESCPLEKAHIIPWHKSKNHNIENLICLCANCHQRADTEKWGEQILKEYKKRPWVLRKGDNNFIYKSSKLKIIINFEFENYSEMYENLLRHSLANFLNIPKKFIKITEESIEDNK